MLTYLLQPCKEYLAVVTAVNKKDAVSFKFMAESDSLAVVFVAGLYANRKEGITEIKVWRETTLVGWVDPTAGSYGEVYDVKRVDNNQEEGKQ